MKGIGSRFLAALLISGLAACSSSDASSNDPGLTSSDDEVNWRGDPCSLLEAGDIALLTPAMTIDSSEAHEVNSDQFSPTCTWYLQGDGSSSTVGLMVQPESEFTVQRAVFSGTGVSGLCNDAWQGNAQGQQDDTVGCLVDDWSFIVDCGYAFDYDDLKLLAAAIALRLK